MEETTGPKYYIGIILLFILITLYLLNFIRTMNITNVDTFMSNTLPLFLVLFGSFIVVVGFIRFYTSQSQPTVFGGSILSLLGLLVGSIFMQNVGDKNNTSMFGLLYYFGLLFGSIFLWKSEVGQDGPNKPKQTVLEQGQIKYLGMFIAYSLLLVVLYLVNPGGIMTKFGGASIFLSLFVGLLLLSMVVGYTFVDKNGNVESFGPTVATLTKGLYIFMSLFLSCFLIWWILDTIGVFANNADSNWFSILFNFVVLLGALTVVYKFVFYGGWLEKSPFYRLFVNAFLYIPCLFSGLVDRLRGFKSSSPTNPFAGTQKSDVVALLGVLGAISITLILAYWVIPALKKWHYLKGGNLIIDEPVAIDKETVTKSFAELNNVPNDATTLTPSYNYGISFWIYIDSFPPSTGVAYSKHSQVLDYGGVPLVKYYAATNTLGVYIKNQEQKNERLLYAHENVELQKWNNVVINYSHGTMDVFYNGQLASSSINVSPPIVFDTLTVGMNDGISGNLANLVYYQTPLTSDEITALYNSFKTTSPPVLSKMLNLVHLLDTYRDR